MDNWLSVLIALPEANATQPKPGQRACVARAARTLPDDDPLLTAACLFDRLLAAFAKDEPPNG
jgi:hypothetical protein